MGHNMQGMNRFTLLSPSAELRSDLLQGMAALMPTQHWGSGSSQQGLNLDAVGITHQQR